MKAEEVLKGIDEICGEIADVVQRSESKSKKWRKDIAEAFHRKLAEKKSEIDNELKEIQNREQSEYEDQVVHVGKILGDKALYVDASRLSRGIEDETRAWFRRYRTTYHRARKILASVKQIVSDFDNRVNAGLESFIAGIKDEALRTCSSKVQTQLDEIQKHLNDMCKVDVDRNAVGELRSKPIVHDNAGLLVGGYMQLGCDVAEDRHLPIVIDSTLLNVISYSYPRGARSSLAQDNCKALLSNAVWQFLLHSLPLGEVHVLDGDALLSGFDSRVSRLSRHFDEMDKPIVYHHQLTSNREFSACIEEISERLDGCLPSGESIGDSAHALVILLMPAITDVAPFKKSIEEAMERWGSWLHIVVAGQTTVLDQFGDWDERYCISRKMDFAEDGAVVWQTGCNRVKGLAQIADWQKDDPTRRSWIQLVLDGLANPPKPISDKAVIIKTAHIPSRIDAEGHAENYGLIFDKEHSGTTFIEGAPGTGKSVLLTQMLTAAMEEYAPRDLQFYLMDLKGGLTFRHFDKIPHVSYILKVKGESDGDVVRSFIELIRDKNNHRMSLFEQAGVQNLDDYNGRMVKSGHAEMVLSRMIIVFDECRPLFTANQREGRQTLETALKELLRSGRALGLHFIFTSQNRGDLPSDYYDFFEHYFLLRKSPNYQIRHYNKPGEAKADHDEYRFGTFLQPYQYNENEILERLGKLRNSSAETIALDAGSYQTITGFPKFSSVLTNAREKGKEVEPSRLIGALGVSLGRVDSLQTIEFSPTKDKPNLLITGRSECGSTSLADVTKGIAPRDACLSLLVDTLAEASGDIKLSVIDLHDRLSAQKIPALTRTCVTHATQIDSGRAALCDWMDSARGLKTVVAPHVLIVNDAQILMELLDSREKEQKESSTCGLNFAGLNLDGALGKLLSPELLSEGKKTKATTDENLFDDFKKSVKTGCRNQAYLILVTDSPGSLETVMCKATNERGFSLATNFRIVHFDFTGERLGALRRSFDNRSPIDGNLLESGEFENELATRFLPFMPFDLRCAEEAK